MATNPVSSATTPTAQSGTGLANAIPSNMNITEAGFLRLISAQMTNQNPLNPADPNQFLTQIEGLSQVSSLQSMQNSMSGLASSLQASQVLSGTSLLDHTVLVPGTTGTLAAGGTVNGAATAPAGATSLNVVVKDASGALVSAFAVAPQSSGLTDFTWDGKTSTGAAAPAGQYTLDVSATVNGNSQAVSPLVYSKVDSVTLDPSTQALQLNTVNGQVPLSSVVSIR